MELLIDFCYTTTITIEEENVQQLLPAACLLQMTQIQQYCCEFLSKQLHPSNCLGKFTRFCTTVLLLCEPNIIFVQEFEHLLINTVVANCCLSHLLILPNISRRFHNLKNIYSCLSSN